MKYLKKDGGRDVQEVGGFLLIPLLRHAKKESPERKRGKFKQFYVMPPDEDTELPFITLAEARSKRRSIHHSLGSFTIV